MSARAKVERPNCLACRKPLRTAPGRRQKEGVEEPRRFGDYADDLFCGLSCGYRFAVSLMGEVRRGEAEVRVTPKGRALIEAAKRRRQAALGNPAADGAAAEGGGTPADQGAAAARRDDAEREASARVECRFCGTDEARSRALITPDGNFCGIPCREQWRRGVGR